MDTQGVNVHSCIVVTSAHGWRNNNMMAYVEKMRIMEMEQDNAQISIGMHQR